MTSQDDLCIKNKCVPYQQCKNLVGIQINNEDKEHCKIMTYHHCSHYDLYNFGFNNLSHRIVVTIRNPVDRVVSEFKHVLLNPAGIWDYCAKTIISKLPNQSSLLSKENFIEFIDKYGNYTRQGMYNRQTRMLGLYEEIYDDINKPSEMLLYAIQSLLDQSTDILVTDALDESSAVLLHSYNLYNQWNSFRIKAIREKTDKSKVNF